MGDIIGDISSRRGRIEGTEMRSGAVAVRGLVPLAEMFGYSTDLRSETQGRGVYVMQFDHFEKLPDSLLEKINK
jgi:elongation factor G